LTHKSKLAGFIIDCNTADLDRAAAFWSGALGLASHRPPGEEGQKYVKLLDPRGELQIEVQKVGHDSRVHLDIEADDVEAEVRRLEALGAKRLKQVKTWWVLEAPTGQRFCVIRKASRGFEEQARQWD
jgi:predicted enzyme related to lactoylglutathione lyase